MPLIYIDKALNNVKNNHPAMMPDVKHPCYRMVREAIEGKSVFHWDKKQAYAMYDWYCDGWRSADLESEFGERVSEYDFREIIENSYYMVGKKAVSEETIKGMWEAVKMEHKVLKSIGEEEVADDEG